ncbi:MAG: RNA polymerase sigma factor [Polyangiaceae bacterium]|nr:RNA polymerase sigma factor [Polyangiaceae bacterium]
MTGDSAHTAATAKANGAAPIEEKIAAGDYQGALAQCAETYAVPLSRYAMAFTGSQSESEGLVEEILLAAAGSFPQYRAGKDVKAWLFGIARRICGRHIELRARKTGHGGAMSNGSPAAKAREALAKLKPSEREAVVLRYEAGLSVRELAIACGVDEASARKRVSKGLVRLRTELGEE